MTLISKIWNFFLYFFAKKEINPYLVASHHLKSFEERAFWLKALCKWVSWNKRPRPEFDDPTLGAQASRLGFLIHVLEKHPEHKKAVGIQLWALLNESSSQALFSSSGLSSEKSFLSELLSILWQKILPSPSQKNDLASVFDEIFGIEKNAEWLEALPTSQIEYFVKLIKDNALDSSQAFKNLQDSIHEALLILGSHIASTSFSRNVLQRSTKQNPQDSVFFKYSKLIQETNKINDSIPNIEEYAGLCRIEIDSILEKIETTGVSVKLVYDLESLQSWITRTLVLCHLLSNENNKTVVIQEFLSDLAHESMKKRSVRALIKENIHILSRKIVERTGSSGESYISKSLSDFIKLFYKALGGGVLTAFTLIEKYHIALQQFPLFFDGLFLSLNYAGSFILIQFFHFTLATKQPSMTAPNLAGKLLDFEENKNAEPFIEEVARIVRSQFISVIGNVLAVIPMALFLDRAWHFRTGHSIFDQHYSEHTLHSLDIFHSLTIPFAAFTGILLWISSVCAGWFENWVVYENIPQAIANSKKIRKFIGKRGAEWVGHSFLKQASSFGGSVSLGFLLGFTGVFGKFFGLPIEVRHVTLSTGSLALAVSQLMSTDPEIWQKMTGPVLGILCIGFLNVTVSFLFALFIAARARNVKRGVLRYLLKVVSLNFLKKPIRFFYPVK